jgi:hypothetical protein
VNRFIKSWLRIKEIPLDQLTTCPAEPFYWKDEYSTYCCRQQHGCNVLGWARYIVVGPNINTRTRPNPETGTEKSPTLWQQRDWDQLGRRVAGIGERFSFLA